MKEFGISLKGVVSRMCFLAFLGALMLSCGKGGSDSDLIPDDGIFGSTGAEFVEIFLTDPNEVRLEGRIFNETAWEMEKVYPDFNVFGEINQKYREELDKKVKEKMSQFDMPAIKEKWEKRFPELVVELSTIEVPAKVEEGTPLKLVSPVRLKDFDKTIKRNYMVLAYTVELTEDIVSPVFSGAGLRFMDADGNEITSSSAQGLKDAFQEGLKKGRQLELITDIALDNKSIKSYFSAKYVMLSWNTFYVDDGKIGPVQVGMYYTDLPKSVPGLYDKFDYKKETIENEMEGDYEVESCTFFKDGKEYFSANLDDGKVISIILDENSSRLRTKDGYSFGYNVLGLYQSWTPKNGLIDVKNIRETLEWENYYEGEVFVTIGRYTFYVPSDMAKTEFPKTRHDFKDGASISRIVCK